MTNRRDFITFSIGAVAAVSGLSSTLPAQEVTTFVDKYPPEIRRIFDELKAAIHRANQHVLFEVNNPQTRQRFVDLVKPTLKKMQDSERIGHFDVICDETNNWGERIDKGELIMDLFFQPINPTNNDTFMQLGVVLAPQGVTF